MSPRLHDQKRPAVQVLPVPDPRAKAEPGAVRARWFLPTGWSKPVRTRLLETGTGARMASTQRGSSPFIPSNGLHFQIRHQHRVLDDLIEVPCVTITAPEEAVGLFEGRPWGMIPVLASFSVTFRKDPSGRQMSPAHSRQTTRGCPRITRLVALAFRFERQLAEGVVRKLFRELARPRPESRSSAHQPNPQTTETSRLRSRSSSWLFLATHRYLSESEIRRASSEGD